MRLVLCAVLALSACAHSAPADDPQARFFAQLSALCGKSFVGRLVSADPLDKDFAGKRLVVEVRDCSTSEIRMPFAVGEDRSRTWIVSRTGAGLRLKHDHRHADGSEDKLSRYGGDTTSPGTADRQEFPADDFSKLLFREHGNPASVDNVWAFELIPAVSLTYELKRPNRDFRVAFDLSAPPG